MLRHTITISFNFYIWRKTVELTYLYEEVSASIQVLSNIGYTSTRFSLSMQIGGFKNK